MGRKGQMGEMTDSEVPVWDPLEAAIGDELVGWFMWMYEGRLDDGTTVHAYKHRATRRYLFLDADGGAYGYDEGRYPRFLLSRAINAVFFEWPDLGGSRADMALVDAAWERARRSETGGDGRAAA